MVVSIEPTKSETFSGGSEGGPEVRWFGSEWLHAIHVPAKPIYLSKSVTYAQRTPQTIPIDGRRDLAAPKRTPFGEAADSPGILGLLQGVPAGAPSRLPRGAVWGCVKLGETWTTKTDGVK